MFAPLLDKQSEGRYRPALRSTYTRGSWTGGACRIPLNAGASLKENMGGGMYYVFLSCTCPPPEADPGRGENAAESYLGRYLYVRTCTQLLLLFCAARPARRGLVPRPWPEPPTPRKPGDELFRRSLVPGPPWRPSTMASVISMRQHAPYALVSLSYHPPIVWFGQSCAARPRSATLATPWRSRPSCNLAAAGP